MSEVYPAGPITADTARWRREVSKSLTLGYRLTDFVDVKASGGAMDVKASGGARLPGEALRSPWTGAQRVEELVKWPCYCS
jgi:hypothetical protein